MNLNSVVSTLQAAVGSDQRAKAALEIVLRSQSGSTLPRADTDMGACIERELAQRGSFLSASPRERDAALSTLRGELELLAVGFFLRAPGGQSHISGLVQVLGDRSVAPEARTGAFLLLATLAAEGAPGAELLSPHAAAITRDVPPFVPTYAAEACRILTLLGSKCSAAFPAMVSHYERFDAEWRAATAARQLDSDSWSRRRMVFATLRELAHGCAELLHLARLSPEETFLCREFGGRDWHLGMEVDKFPLAIRAELAALLVDRLRVRPWSSQVEESLRLLTALSPLITPAAEEFREPLRILRQLAVRDRYGLASGMFAVLERWSSDEARAARTERARVDSGLKRLAFPLLALRHNRMANHCSWIPEDIR